MPVKPPLVENAPGLIWRPRKVGWEARWQGRTDLVRRGYEPKSVRLWSGVEPSEIEKLFISDRCNSLQSDMLVWGRGGLPVVGVFDGTVRSLIASFRSDQDSGYHKLRIRTRRFYDTLCRRLETDHGEELIANVKARNVLRWHESWSADGKIAMGHAMVGMLRTLLSFGLTILEDEECGRLSGVLSKMRFPMAKPRLERLTAEYAIAIRAKAHENNKPSLALAQAFQFELMLRQKDVIGEWMPISEPGVSDVISGNEKWLRGIRWEGINENLVLRHVTSKRQKEIEVDLRNAPMVLEELCLFAGLPVGSVVSRDLLPKNGPIIKKEIVNIPYTDSQFRREWRELAELCDIPKTVKNMDSRAGAISEATDADANLEHVRHAATHSDISMTQKYSRNAVEKTAKVQHARVAYRNKPGS